MRPATAFLLLIVGAAVAATGWYFGVAQAPQPTTAVTAGGTLVFPDLAQGLQKATKVEIVHQDKTVDLELKDGLWRLGNVGLYPIQQHKLRELLTGLTELRLVEQRTSDPAQFGRLGVDDPKGASAGGDLVRILGDGDQPIAELIIGHKRARAEGNVPDSVYIRRPSENQVWLSEGRIAIDEDPKLWLDRQAINIPADQIASVVVTRGSDHIELDRNGTALEMKAPTDHPPLDTSKLEDVAKGLENVSLVDVKPDAADVGGDKVADAVFTTTDGLNVQATLLKLGTEQWARFAASGDAAAKEHADTINGTVRGWLYQLGSWKERSIFPAMDDLKAPPPAKEESETPAAGGAPPSGLPAGLNLPQGATPQGPRSIPTAKPPTK
jgi:hypothetical protein